MKYASTQNSAASQPKTEADRHTVEEYLALDRASEERHEYLDGVVYALASESGAHADICMNLAMIIATQLRGTPCRARSKDTKVRGAFAPEPGTVMKGLFSYPDLRWVCALPYVFGEGLGPAFSPDERRLALAWATNPSLDRTDAVGVGDEAVTTTGCVVDWACLHVRTLPAADRASGGGSEGGEPKGSPPGDEVCALRVRVSPGDPIEGNESYYPEDLRFHDTDVIGFRTAWGEEVRLALPLPTSVTVPGPRA